MAAEVIKSVRRVFEILEYFDSVSRPMSLNEVATHFGYPTSSTAAMLKSMMLLGYLNYDAVHRTYLPTLRLSKLGSWAHDAISQETPLVVAIERLSQSTGETVSIAAQSEIYSQYLHVAVTKEPLQYRVAPGTLRPVTNSGTGWMLLSAQDDEAIELIWRKSNRMSELQGPSISLGELMQKVNEARGQGYIVSRHTFTQGTGIVAMLLPTRFFGRTLVIGVGGPVWRTDGKLDLILNEMRASIAQFTIPG